MSQDLLTIRNLAVNFNGLPAVDRINLSIAPGEVVGVVGESAGQERDDDGADGPDRRAGQGDGGRSHVQRRRPAEGVAEGAAARSSADIAMVFQDALTSLNPSYTVGYQIKEVLKLHEGLRGDALHRRALELLDRSAFPMRRTASRRSRTRCRAG